MKRLQMALLAFAVTLPAAAPVAGQAGFRLVLQPGDAVNVRIWPDDQGYSGDYVIGTSGTLALPYVGEIQAAGVPVEELESNIRRGYEATRSNVVVSILPRFNVAVTGMVRSPSVYPVTPTQNIFDVIALAGGFTAGADQEEVRIVREGEVVNVNALMSLRQGVDLNRYRLRSGDQIVVPAAGGISIRTVFEIVRTVSTLVLVYDRLANSN